MKPFLLLMLATIAMIAYVQRTLGQAAGEIQREFGLTKEQFGDLGFVWFSAYAAMQLPCGWLADRIGGRKAIVLFAVAWSLCTAAAGCALDRWSLMALWALMGAAQAGVFPAAVSLIRRWFPDEQRALASGTLAGSMAVGAMLAPLSFAFWSREGYSWRTVLIGHGAPGVLWAIAFWTLAPEETRLPHAKEDDSAPNKPPAGSKPASDRDEHPLWRVALLLATSGVWLLFLQQFARAGGTTFFQTWFPTFVRETHNVEEFDSGWLASIVGLGGLIGGVCGGAFSDWLFRATNNERLSRQGVAMFGTAMAAVAIAASFWAPTPMRATLCMGAAAMFAAIGGVGAYTLAMRIGGRDTATIFALMNMCGNLGAAAYPKLVGRIVDKTESWNGVLTLVSGTFLAAAVCWGLLRVRPAETKTS